MSADLPPRLASVRDELEATTATLHRIVDPLDDAAWRRRPEAGRWSVAECIQHLNLTSREMTPRLRDAARDARSRGWTKSSQRMDFMGWFLVHSLEPPAKAAFKTAGAFVPPSIEPKEKAIREYEDRQGDLVALLAELDGLALTRMKIMSPFNARVRYNAYSALRVIAAHQRRHLWQAERVLATFTRAAR